MNTICVTRRVQTSFFAILLMGFVGVMGCSSAKKSDDGSATNNENEAVEKIDGADDAARLGESDKDSAVGLQTVNFSYDSFALDDAAKQKLQANAELLKANGNVKIQVEGHCDKRGSIQYNLALGEKRANSVRKYLQGLGISGKRLSTISFGKEHLLDSGESEEAHSRNRRANFVLTAK